MNVERRHVARQPQVKRTPAGVLLATLSLGVCGPAFAAETQPPTPRQPVVAQSTEATAATGSLPISARIARARRPIQVIPDATIATEITTSASEKGRQEALPPVSPVPTTEPAATVPTGPRSERFTYPVSVAEGLPAGDKTAGAPVMSAAPVSLRVLEPMTKAAIGQPIEWRLQVYNNGSETVGGVTAMLFFAEGIEPVAASGGEASLAAGEVRFPPLAPRGPGETVELLITGVGTSAGTVAYRAEVVMAGIDDVVAEDGIVHVTAR
ncbi:MAG: hypothetical protein ACO3NZ_15450 [Pirellulales bacterium]